MHYKLFLFFTFVFTFTTATAQTDNGKANNSKLIQVSQKVYMYQSKGGNIGIYVGKTGLFMVDSQYADNIKEALSDIKNISKNPVKFLLNTHLHGDHTGGNTFLAKKGAIIFSQENVRSGLQKMMKDERNGKFSTTLPEITFTEDLTFYIDGRKILVKHIHNAHTDGDAIVYFPRENVIHTGDILFNNLYPFIDTKNGGSVEGVIDGLNAILLLADEDTKIIPGHGDLATRADVETSMYMLKFLFNRVMMAYRQTKTLEEIQAMNLTQKYDKKYSWKFIDGKKIVEIIYNDIKQKHGPVDTRTMEQRLQDKLKEAQKKMNKKGKTSNPKGR